MFLTQHVDGVEPTASGSATQVCSPLAHFSVVLARVLDSGRNKHRRDDLWHEPPPCAFVIGNLPSDLRTSRGLAILRPSCSPQCFHPPWPGGPNRSPVENGGSPSRLSRRRTAPLRDTPATLPSAPERARSDGLHSIERFVDHGSQLRLLDRKPHGETTQISRVAPRCRMACSSSPCECAPRLAGIRPMRRRSATTTFDGRQPRHRPNASCARCVGPFGHRRDRPGRLWSTRVHFSRAAAAAV